MRFIFEQIRTGGDRNFAYLVGDREARAAAIVDPAHDPDGVVARAREQGLEVGHILNTHGHPDHTGGNRRARELTGAVVVAHPEAPVAADRTVGDGEAIEVGSLRIRVHHVPGHTPDHLLLHLAEQKVAMTGDLLFVGKIGGTHSDAEARAERESLIRLLDLLGDDVTIWPGHDYGCRPATTVALEKATNPFLQRLDDVDAFLDLKREWARFKSDHGLR